MSNENMCPQVLGGVLRELRKLAERPPAGIKLLLRGDDVSDVRALLEGPVGTPYEGGVFEVRLSLGAEYPAAPPRAQFVTRVFHPNVSARGEVCVNTLKRDWRPALGVQHALLALRCLLIAPNADSALDADAAALLRDHYPSYAARAKLYTEIHAKPRAQPTQKTESEPRGAAEEPRGAAEEPRGAAEEPRGAAEEPLAKQQRRAPRPATATTAATTAATAAATTAATAAPAPLRPAPGGSKADRERRRVLKRL